jgi:hypothetical protein
MAVALHLSDWRALIADERVRLCCGPDALEQFDRWASSDDWNFAPVTVFEAPAWDAGRAKSVEPRMRQINAAFNERERDVQNAVSELYRGRDGSWWARRYDEALSGQGRPLRVLGITSRFTCVLQYSTRDALAAFETAGCQTRLLIEPNNYARLSPVRTLRAVQEFEPDLLFLIDHIRQVQCLALTADLPVLTWIQDRLPWLFSAKTGAALGPLDFCMGFAFKELTERYGYPADRFWPCDMATNPDVLWPGGRRPEGDAVGALVEDPRWRCDVAYATSHAQTPTELFEQLQRRCGPMRRRLLEAAFDELRARCERAELNGGLWWQRFVEQIEQQVGQPLSDEQRGDLIQDYVRPLVDRLLRHQTVAWAAEWAEQTGGTFRLYGRGWDRHPAYRKYAWGFVEHGPEFGAALRGTKINLHAGCNPAKHQRVLDTLSAGGFMLVRRHADDVGPRLYRALHQEVVRRGLKAGDRVRWWERLPAPFDREYLELRAMLGLDPHEEVVLREESIANYRCYAEGRYPTRAVDIWPEFYDVTFGSAAEFVERVAYYLDNEEQRRATADAMRQRAIELFSYRDLIRRVLPWLRDRFREAGSTKPVEVTPCTT